MSDTAESVRKFNQEWEDAHRDGDWVSSWWRAQTIVMLERYALLLERSAGEWVSVEERLPNEPGEYLCLHENSIALSPTVMLDFGGRTEWHCAGIWNPTHWLDVRKPGERDE
jgi:hypothetical protein